VRPDLQKLAEAIVAAGERGAELTQRLLAFSRRQTLIPAEIDCNHLVASMQQLLRRTLREDIEIETFLDPELANAVADPAQLESAILNLALNAQDAMPGGGCLSISTTNAALDESYRDMHPEVTPGRYIMLAVTDDGEGMLPEVLARVFEPFFTTKEVGKGSGLGLSMVYGFVKQSAGHVTIYSEPGLGTTVRIYLPASVDKPDAPTLSSPRHAEADALPMGIETILVVEDDPFVRAYAVRTLDGLGYHVVAAVNGPEALSRLHGDERIDLLFTDVVMPGGMNGWELAEQARALRPSLKILLTSGYALETLLARGRLRSDMAFLNKPYRKAELAQRLRETLEASVC
jgi:CheY-like chemotaxis protein/two-component sensor histidine kinase